MEGEALNLIHSLQLTETNYDIALDLLKQRYERTRLIINGHVQSLIDLPAIKKENSAELRKFLDNYNRHINALRKLNEPVDSWSSILICILSAKLDFYSKREWESKLQSNILPTLSAFSSFLTHRSQVLESLYCININNNDKKNKFVGTKSVNHIATNKTLSCYFCKKDHLIYHCNDFLKLSVHGRIDTIKQHKLCFNCLRPFIKNHTCSGNCKTCKRKHNTLIHIDKHIDSDREKC